MKATKLFPDGDKNLGDSCSISVSVGINCLPRKVVPETTGVMHDPPFLGTRPIHTTQVACLK